MQWRETGRYTAPDESTVKEMVKPNNSYWDGEAEEKRVEFELTLKSSYKAGNKGGYLYKNDGVGVLLVEESKGVISENFRKKHMHNATVLTLHL